MNKLIFTFLLLLTCAFSMSAQTTRTLNSDMMMKRCADSKTYYSSFILQPTGDLMFTPCPGKTNIFNNTLQIRKNSEDYFPYSQGLDIINEFSTADTFGQNMNSDFYVNDSPFSYSSIYTNARFTTKYRSVNRAGALLGLFSNATLASEAPVHDIQGIHGEAIAVSGSAASGMYGGAFNVGLFGGTNHGNIADMVIGASSVRDTDIKNYYRLWIKKPTIANATFREGRNYSIYQEGPFGSEFQAYLFLNNGTTNSSGAAVSPLQVKLANAQTADAVNIRDANDIPLFSVNAGGQIRIAQPKTPSSSSDACAVGTISWDANNVYVCVAENTWRRSQLTSF